MPSELTGEGSPKSTIVRLAAHLTYLRFQYFETEHFGTAVTTAVTVVPQIENLQSLLRSAPRGSLELDSALVLFTECTAALAQPLPPLPKVQKRSHLGLSEPRVPQNPQVDHQFSLSKLPFAGKTHFQTHPFSSQDPVPLSEPKP